MIRTAVLALVLFTGSLFAQSDSMIMVPKSMVPKSVVTQVEAQNMIASYGRFAGIGKEIGVGIREGLGALTDETNKFANTKVGKFTMIIIAFKVFGLQLVQFGFGITLWVIGTILAIFLYRKFIMPRRVLESVDKDGKKTYKIFVPCDDNRSLNTQ